MAGVLVVHASTDPQTVHLAVKFVNPVLVAGFRLSKLELLANSGLIKFQCI